MKNIEMPQKILDIAEELVTKNGFSATSYKQISEIIGIKTSSIHYYFPSKTDLGEQLIARYYDVLVWTVQEIDALPHSCQDKLAELINTIFKITYHNQRRMCLAGMLSIDTLIMDPKINVQTRRVFELLEKWLARQIQAGIDGKEFNYKEPPKQLAQMIIAMIEGTLLLSRLFDREAMINNVNQFIKGVTRC